MKGAKGHLRQQSHTTERAEQGHDCAGKRQMMQTGRAERGGMHLQGIPSCCRIGGHACSCVTRAQATQDGRRKGGESGKTIGFPVVGLAQAEAAPCPAAACRCCRSCRSRRRRRREALKCYTILKCCTICGIEDAGKLNNFQMLHNMCAQGAAARGGAPWSRCRALSCRPLRRPSAGRGAE